MSDLSNITVEARSDSSKGYASQVRMAGRVPPAVICGHGAEPVHILLPAKQTTLAVRQSNALLTMDLDCESHVALVKDVQRPALRQTVDHLDLLTVLKAKRLRLKLLFALKTKPHRAPPCRWITRRCWFPLKPSTRRTTLLPTLLACLQSPTCLPRT